MRIVLVNKFAHVTGGADRHCLDLAAALRARGHEVRFLSTESSANVDSSGAFVHCSVTHANRDRMLAIRRVGVAARALWNPHAAAAMRALIEDFRPHVVHAHKLFPQLSVAPVVVASRAGVPIVQTLHDYEFAGASALDERGRWLDHLESRASYRALNALGHVVRRLVHVPSVKRWIAVSRFLARAYAGRGIAATVLPNFVAPNGSPPLDAERAGVVFAARLTPEKGVRDVLALARLAPEFAVTIAGDGPLRAEVEREAARRPNLSYIGALDHDAVRRLIGSARALVMPSLWQEPGPLTAIEAMATGTPIVAYPSGGLAEYVADSRAGLVVAEQPCALAEACRRLHVDEDAFASMSRDGLRAARERHSPDRYVERLETIYEEAGA